MVVQNVQSLVARNLGVVHDKQVVEGACVEDLSCSCCLTRLVSHFLLLIMFGASKLSICLVSDACPFWRVGQHTSRTRLKSLHRCQVLRLVVLLLHHICIAPIRLFVEQAAEEE